jgi:hypothetical protein
MQEGRDLRDKGNAQEALKRFQAADAIMHVPTTGLEVARTQVALGLLVEARDTIAAIRRTPASPSDPEPFTAARAKAEELDKSLEGRIPSLIISVRGAAEGEKPTVTIDGVALPPAVLGLPRSVDAGHHVVIAKTGSGEAKQEVDVADKEQKEVQLMIVAQSPGDSQTPSDNGPTSPEAPAGPVSHSPDVWTYVGVGVGGVGLIVGAVTGVMVLSKKPAITRECNPNQTCPSGKASNDLDSANTLATVSTVAFIAGVAGAGVAVVSLILGHPEEAPSNAAPPPPPPEARLRVTPWIGLGAAGVRGSF